MLNKSDVRCKKYKNEVLKSFLYIFHYDLIIEGPYLLRGNTSHFSIFIIYSINSLAPHQMELSTSYEI